MPWNPIMTDNFTGITGNPPNSGLWDIDNIGASSVAEIDANTLRLFGDGSAGPPLSRAGVVSTPGSGDVLNARLDLDVFIPQGPASLFTTYGPRFSTTLDDHYFVNVLSSAGNLVARLQKTVGGVNTNLTSDLDLGAVEESFRIRVQILGSQLKAAVRLISAGALVEGDWDLQAVDTDLEVADPVFLRCTTGEAGGAAIFLDDFVLSGRVPASAGPLNAVDINSIAQDGGTSVVLRVLSAVPAGVTVFVAIGDADPGLTSDPACSDIQSNVYTRDFINQDGQQVALFRSHNITALSPGDTITVSSLENGAHVASAFYVAGLSNAAPVGTVTNNGSSTTPSTGNLVVAQDNVLIVGALGVAGQAEDVISSEDASYNTVLKNGTLNAGTSTDRTSNVAVRHLATGATISYAPTLNTVRAWRIGLAAYQVSAAVGSPLALFNHYYQ